MRFAGRAALLAALLMAAAGCGGTLREQHASGSASYASGKAAFDRGDYLDAISDLKSYVEQFPGTEWTDDALYYLGEAYVGQKDYALASGQFDRLLRDFPSSPFEADALFELARCDDLQSHAATLDQTESERAVGRYHEFLDRYPDHAKAAVARERVQALRDRLAEKRYRTGRLYWKLRQDGAAVIALREIPETYADTRWYGDAAFLLADVLLRQGNQVEAVETLKRLAASVPEGNVRRRAAERLRALESAGTPR
jgi:outer membrane protein assembly factor BamD